MSKKQQYFTVDKNLKVVWLDGCKEYRRKSCLDCPYTLAVCPAEHPRQGKCGHKINKISEMQIKLL